MKKQALLLCIGLVSNILNAIAFNPVRTWQCRPTNPQSNCSQQDKNNAKEVFKTVMLEKLAEILAESGITTTIYQLQLERNAAESIQATTAARAQQFGAAKQAVETSESQRQRVIQQISR